MRADVFAAIRDALLADPTLVGLLGGPYIYRARGVQPANIPSITLLENNESSKLRVGYNTFRTRDQSPTLQVDVWIDTNQADSPCTGEDADDIAERIDYVLFSSPPTGTRSWSRTSSSTQHDEDIGGIHIARRYSFAYQTTD